MKKTPCPNKQSMAPFDCDHKEQCWEPCGELGHDERFVAVVPVEDRALFDKQHEAWYIKKVLS